MDIPPDEEEVRRRSRSPSYKLASPRWSIARIRTLEIHAEKLRERLECISPPRWKSREELYAQAIAEPYDKAGVRLSPITPTPPSVLSPSPRPSPYQPSLYSHLSSMSPRSMPSLSPPTTRSMSLDDNSSLTSFEDALHNITKLATIQSPRQTSPFSRSTSPPSELSKGFGEDDHVSVYQKPIRRKANANIRYGGRTQLKYRIEKAPSHHMITRSKRREGIR
jgi:hypothetical protein